MTNFFNTNTKNLEAKETIENGNEPVGFVSTAADSHQTKMIEALKVVIMVVTLFKNLLYWLIHLFAGKQLQ